MSNSPSTLGDLAEEIAGCRSCSRLVEWREHASSHPRSVGEPSEYWAKAVPGFGDERARLLIVGLAPAAHGANRTGRMFTGDRSGDFLVAALYRAGLANQPLSTSRDDGLLLDDVYITSAVHCAPPDNKPTRDERHLCATYLKREIAALENLAVILALGAFALDALVSEGGLSRCDDQRIKFAHAAEFAARVANRNVTVVSSYHPSQRNVFTGLLTAAMFDDVVRRSCELLSRG